MKTLILVLLGTWALAAQAAEEKAIVNEQKINVRGQPSLVGEVITQLQKGEQVTILEFIKNERAKGGEPTNWAKIKLPSNTPVWVYAPMIKDGAVGASRLNLRAGPGDNYSVIGRLTKGDKVNIIRTMGDWIEIEAPAGAYAFIDASLVKSGASSAPVVASTPRIESQPAVPIVAAPALSTQQPSPSTPVERPSTSREELAPPIQPQVKVEPTPVVQAPVPSSNPTVVASAAPEHARVTESSAPLSTASSAKAQPAPAREATSARRIVRREGIIRPTRSIQAPTWYELVHPQTKKTIDYLHEEKLGVKLKQFKGQKVVVSGEEAIDPRWPNTPILEIETLDIAP